MQSGCVRQVVGSVGTGSSPCPGTVFNGCCPRLSVADPMVSPFHPFASHYSWCVWGVCACAQGVGKIGEQFVEVCSLLY